MNVLVIEASGLHLGYVGCYGNDWVATPHLNQLAAEGVAFDQHIADAPGALVPTSWTGRAPLPSPDGAPPRDTGPDLAKLLEAEGGRLIRVGTRTAFGQAPPHALNGLESLIDQAGQALVELAETDPGVLWLHLPNLSPPWQIAEEYLGPYFPPGPPTEGEEQPTPWFDPPVGPHAPVDDAQWRRLQNSYGSAVTYVDDHLGLLWEMLHEIGLTDDILLCFTADRGLALLEHGVIGECRPWLHDELVHLPMVLRFPNAAQAGRRVLTLTQPADLMPTILAALELPIPDGLHGHNLLPLAHGQATSVRPYACTGLAHGNRLEWAIRTPDWAYLLPVRQGSDDPPRPAQLYVKPDDRWELNNLLQQRLDLGERLEQTLRGYVAASQQPGPLRPPALLPDE